MGVMSEVRFISGKGGVGKSVVATAMALAEAARGRRVLLVEINGGDRVSALLGIEPVGSTVREVFEDVFIVDVNPRDSIHEYVLLTLKFEAIYKTVFENRVVRRLLRLVPALGELVMLGKVWFHAQETVHDKPRFDVIIVDAPATGHGRALLAAPRAVAQSVPAGPMRDNACLIDDMITDKARTCLHVVTTPEEMPVAEAIELTEAAQALNIAPGAIIVNQAMAPLPQGALEALAPLQEAAVWAGVPHALAQREAARQSGEAELARLGATGWPVWRLPRLVQPVFDRQAVEILAKVLGENLSDKSGINPGDKLGDVKAAADDKAPGNAVATP